jgi:hypothetical protein
MKTLQQIIKEHEDGKHNHTNYTAITECGARFDAVYDHNFKTMFYAIPSNYNVVGYEAR